MSASCCGSSRRPLGTGHTVRAEWCSRVPPFAAGVSPAPLVPVPEVATELGVGRVLVKDESSRLGLPALRSSVPPGPAARCLNGAPRRARYATDGNRGHAVDRMADHFGLEATVFVPDLMLRETAARVAEEGAKVVLVDGDYDAAVRRAAESPTRGPLGTDSGRRLGQLRESACMDHQKLPDTAGGGRRPAEGTAGPGGGPGGVGSLAEAVIQHYRAETPRIRACSRSEPDAAACVLTETSPATVP